MINDPAAFFRDLFDFIGVDTSVVPPGLDKRMNQSRKTKFVFIPRTIRFVRKTLEAIGMRRAVRALIDAGVGRRLREFNNQYNQVAVDFELSPSERAALRDCYVDDIAELEQLLSRDLSHWMRLK
jgi:hypothetical protein